MFERAGRLIACAAAVAVITFSGSHVIALNGATVGFVYLMLIQVIASAWGFFEAAVASVLAALALNFFFLPPVGTLTIADPQNWVALFSFLTTSLIASRLSNRARRRALDALERQQDLERLYSFSRAILLIGGEEPFPSQLIRRLADTFELRAAELYDRRAGEFFRAGPSDFQGLDQQVIDAARHGTVFSNPAANQSITAVRLGAEPIASLALEGVRMPDSVLQGIANLVAIGLERAKSQDLARQVEVARQSEQLRATLIDAMAHEFKTPLTLIKGVTSSVLAGNERLSATIREQITIADEEAEHLRDLMDNAIEMARLDSAHIDTRLEQADIESVVRETVSSLRPRLDGRPVDIAADGPIPPALLDRRLIRLALKQLLDNALKYSPRDTAVAIRLRPSGGNVLIDVVDRGEGIAPEDRARVFERFYRGRAARNQIPGSGLGLNIARSIVEAHHGEITFTSNPGETVFRMALPVEPAGGDRH